MDFAKVGQCDCGDRTGKIMDSGSGGKRFDSGQIGLDHLGTGNRSRFVGGILGRSSASDQRFATDARSGTAKLERAN